MSKNDFSLDDVRKLLARKRLEVPGEDYFNQILPEFHRRQALAAEQSVWARWQEALGSFVGPLIPRPAMQYALPVIAGVALIGLTYSGLEGNKGTSSPMLALAMDEVPAAQGFAFSEGLTTAADVPEFEIELDEALPHYVLADSASSYDPNLAF